MTRNLRRQLASVGLPQARPNKIDKALCQTYSSKQMILLSYNDRSIEKQQENAERDFRGKGILVEVSVVVALQINKVILLCNRVQRGIYLKQ